jgi:hypothetical protein
MSKIEDLKRENEQMIRECFYNGNIWTKNELSLQTGISLALTTTILQGLQSNKEIIFIGEAESTGGRKSKQYQLNNNYYYILEVVLKREDLFYTFVLQKVDLFNQVLKRTRIQSKTGSIKELLKSMDALLQGDKQITIICLSIPGICQNGFIDICDFEDFVEVDLKQILQERYSIDIVIENDVNVACIGFSHDYKEYQHLAFVYQPRVKYVGCGIMIERKLYNGFSHFAGELSYLPFLSHEQQDQMTKDNPKELLEKQIETLCSVINPAIIGVHSDIIDNDKTLHISNISLIHQPIIAYIEDFDGMISNGLYQIGLKALKEKRGLKGY